MRLLADVIRGMEVEKALAILEHHSKASCCAFGKAGVECYQQLESRRMKVVDAADANLVCENNFC